MPDDDAPRPFDPSHAHLPLGVALGIAQERLGPGATLTIASDKPPLTYRLIDSATGSQWGGLSWRSVLRAARLICDERAGYGFHFCIRPVGHDGECQCYCGETFDFPF